ncbi:uncharacterized oxidoreductase C663.08c isoform X2 [Hippoglossus stenolepis]|uniref:uncharacterized oxidoreductase C663.08c isoform X2 n=1 Tax=Hippoglossus stenolepis TaxID=195615 RepID=UPI001FAEDD56|nr:uncharacterized oxidoreductase C663.08c isoform X2 [Hippoglossus stenolepis]
MSGATRFRQCGSVLVTGASRGIGLQMVESLAGGGFSPGKIIATTRNPGGAQKLQDLALKHPNIHITTLDVLSQESIDKCAEEAFLPLLKAAASRGGAGGSGSMSIQRAAVINMSSVLGSVECNWGESANIKWFPYRTSKSALNMVSRCMAADLEPDGILCMAIHPGWVRTDMGGSQAPLSPEESTSSMLSVIGGLSEEHHGSFLSFTGEVLPW